MRSAEFQVIDPVTGARTPLPDVSSWSVSPVADGSGVVQVAYPAAGRNFALLRAFVDDDRDALVAVRIDGQETPDFTCVMAEAQGDTADPAAIWTFSGRFQAVYLDQAVIYPDPDAVPVTTAGGLGDASRTFGALNAGQVFAPLIAEAQARGAASLVTYASFNSAHDSNGVAWAEVTTTSCSPGISVLSLLNTLAAAGLCEWQMAGADLRLYNPGTLGTDQTLASPPVILHGPRDLTQAQRTFSSKNSVTALLIAGSSGLYTDVSDSAALSRRGRRIEGYVSAGNIADPGTLTAFADVQIAALGPAVLQVTHGLAMDGSGPLPLDDFDVNDWIWSDTGLGLERLQVAQWSVSMDDNGILSGTVTLNNLVASRLVKLQRQISALTSGTAVVGTSTPPPVVADEIAPDPPTGLTASSVAFIAGTGVTEAQVTAAWVAPALNADGSVLTDLAGYNVQWAYASGQGLGTEWHAVAGAVTSTSVSWSPLLPGVHVNVQVQAADSTGNTSAWSSSYNVVTAADATPPPVPSTPSVSPYLGQLKITWDGLSSSAGAMPPDFSLCQVHISLVSGFTPSSATLTDLLKGAGESVATGLTYGDTYYVRLVTQDFSGNASAASAQASAVPVQAANGDVSALSVGKLTAGTLSAAVTVSGRVVAGASLTGARVELNSTGFYLFDTDGVTELVTIEAGNVLLTGLLTTKASSTGNSRIEIGLDANGDQLRVFDASNNEVVSIGQQYVSGSPVSNGIQVSNASGDLIFRLYGSGTNSDQFFYVGKGLGAPYPYIQAHYDGVTASMDYTLTNDDGNLSGHVPQHITGVTFFGDGTYDLRASTFNIMGIGVGSGPTYPNGQGPSNVNFYGNGFENAVSLQLTKDILNFTATTGEGLAINSGSFFTYQGSQHQFHTAGGAGWADTFALSFVVESDSSVKRDIAAVPSGTGLAVVRGAPVRTWKYDQPGAPVMIGCLADDIPSQWLGPKAEGRIARTLSLVNMIGILQQAVFELDQEMDQFRSQVPARKQA